MAISNRHIRHDWQTFHNWEQKSVRTLCGQKSSPRLCGIPGITIQPVKVAQRPGWCPNCMHRIITGRPRTFLPLAAIVENMPYMHPEVSRLYQRVLDVVYEHLNARV